MIENEDLNNRFTFHPADTESKKNQHADVRVSCLSLAVDLNEWLPDCREKAVAIARLEEVMFWANAAIARNQK